MRKLVEIIHRSLQDSRWFLMRFAEFCLRIWLLHIHEWAYTYLLLIMHTSESD